MTTTDRTVRELTGAHKALLEACANARLEVLYDRHSHVVYVPQMVYARDRYTGEVTPHSLNALMALLGRGLVETHARAASEGLALRVRVTDKGRQALAALRAS